MENAYSVVRTFENQIARWAGAKYGVAVSSCCNAIFLCLLYSKKTLLAEEATLFYPKRTYPGAVMSAINAGYEVMLMDIKWKGCYQIHHSKVIDSALRFRKGMYKKNTFHCLSFHYKKHLPIGRGGMILTDDEKAAEWLKMARFDGRQEKPLMKDNATISGWNMYMTPEQAARGLLLFDYAKQKPKLPDLTDQYPDLSKWEVFK